MSEPEWGESWDDWEAESDDYSFGPNGEFMDMSTMDVGWWDPIPWESQGVVYDWNTPTEAEEPEPTTPSASPPPPPPEADLKPKPKEMINQNHFVARIIRHSHYVELLDCVKSRLNICANKPPAGFTSEFFVEEMKKWMEYCEIADNMKGDLRCSGYSNGEVGYMDAVLMKFGREPFYEFVENMKAHDEQVKRDIIAFSEHYSEFFKSVGTDYKFNHDSVLAYVKPDNHMVIPYSKDAPKRFLRGGGLLTNWSLKDRICNFEWARMHLEKICDLKEYGYPPHLFNQK